MTIKKRANKANCKRGYSCGMSCINVKLMCRQDGLAGQFINLADNYFQQAAAGPKAQQELKPKALPEEAGEAYATELIDNFNKAKGGLYEFDSGSYAKVYVYEGKLYKHYFMPNAEALKQEFINKDIPSFDRANKLANETLVQDGLMPRHYGFAIGEDGQIYSVQEMLEGYESAYNIVTTPSKKLDRASAKQAIDKIKSALAKHNVVHNDLNPSNVMFKADKDGIVLDAKLIDADFMAKATDYEDAEQAMRNDAERLDKLINTYSA